MTQVKKAPWTPTRRLGMFTIGIIYVTLGVSWWYIPPRPELDEYFTSIRPWVWIFVGLGAIVTARRAKEPFIFLNLMGALAFERIFVLVLNTIFESTLAWYSTIWYITLWLAACYAYLLPHKKVVDHG